MFDWKQDIDILQSNIVNNFSIDILNICLDGFEFRIVSEPLPEKILEGHIAGWSHIISAAEKINNPKISESQQIPDKKDKKACIIS